MAKIPNLKRRITIATNSQVDDGIGGKIDSWTDVYYVWAEVNQLSDNRQLIYGASTNTVLKSFTVRFRSDFTYTRDMRITYRGEYYNVIDVKELEEQFNYVELVAALKK
jgi:SPP1 family predicted phage head-tail adaptor